jgi:broad specificity phosphatase PhoE
MTMQKVINQNRKKYLVISSIALVFIGVILYMVVSMSHMSTIVLVIRHAEKNEFANCSPSSIYGSPNSSLILVNGENPRAQELVHVCADIGIAAIYASEFCRTQLTVKPLADHLRLPIQIVDQYPADRISNLVRTVMGKYKGKIVLIAGHLDTVPMIIKELSGVTINRINNNEFDNLFVVVIPKWFGKPKVIHLRYGEKS